MCTNDSSFEKKLGESTRAKPGNQLVYLMKPDLGTDLIDLIGVGVRDSVSEDLFLAPAPIAKSSLLQGVICIWTPRSACRSVTNANNAE